MTKLRFSFSQLVTTAIWLVPAIAVASPFLGALLFNIDIPIPNIVTAIPRNPIGESFSPSNIQPKRAAKGGARVIRSWENLAVIIVYE